MIRSILLLLLLALPLTGAGQARVKHLAHSGYVGTFMDARDVDRADLLDAKHLAKLGDIQAQFNVAAMYHALGKHEAAIYWYRRAALFRHPLAAYNLGMLFYEGRHVPHDLTEAVRWLEVAAKANYPQAQTQLGYLVYRGELPGAAPGDEAGWYRRAALGDDPVAQFNLGVILWQGDGVPRDPIEGYAWLTRAAPAVEREDLVASLVGSLTETEREAAEQRLADLGEEIRPFVMR